MARNIPITDSQETLNDVPLERVSLDTPESDAAIDDIVAHEADQVLAAEDAGVRLAQLEGDESEPPTRSGHPIFWFIILLLVVVAIVSAYVVTTPGLELPFAS